MPASLREAWWRPPGSATRFALHFLDRELAERIDSRWSPARPSDAVNRHWRWVRIAERAHARFALIADDGTPAVALAMNRSRLLELPDGPHARLDYFEVAPSSRGGVLGLLGLGVVAHLALEDGAVGLVLGSVDTAQAIRFYEKMGGERGAARGWSAPSELIPFGFDRAALEALRQEVANVREEP